MPRILYNYMGEEVKILLSAMARPTPPTPDQRANKIRNPATQKAQRESADTAILSKP
jgi:hypothetical protein